MNPTPLRRAVVLAAVVLVAAGVVARAGEISDRIWLKGSNDPKVVRITGESLDGIVAGPVGFNITQVVRVRYADAPFAFREAEQHREQGRYDEAIRLYETALKDQVCKRTFWLYPNCRYYIALCHLEDGSADALKAASTAFEALLAQHADTRFKPDAILGLGRIHFEQKDYRSAIRRFDELAQLAAAKNFEEWLYRSYLWKAKSLRTDKQYKEALELIRKIVGAAKGEKFEDVYIEARTEEAVIAMVQGQYDKAIDLLNGLVQRIAPAVAKEIEGGSETRAQRIESTCFNTLGHCYLQMGNKAADAKKKQGYYHEALLKFLWTVVLYQRLPAQHAEALFHAAECFDKLDKRTRATELRNELVQRYPDSPFTRRVQPARAAAGQ